MKAKLQSVALLATARIVFGSSAGGAALRAGAWGLGLLGCGGQATSDEPRPMAAASSSAGATNGLSVGGDGNAGGGGADGYSAGAAAGGSSAGDGSQGGTASSGGYGSATSGGSGESNGGGNNGGGNDSGGGNSGGASGGTLGGEASSGGSSTVEPPPLCVGPTELTVPSLAPGPSEEELRCCLAGVSTATSDWRSPEGDEIMKSAPIVDCCRAIVTAVDLDHTFYKQASRVHTPCCSRYVGEPPEIFQHFLCTPWGPPMPPALDWRAA